MPITPGLRKQAYHSLRAGSSVENGARSTYKGLVTSQESDDEINSPQSHCRRACIQVMPITGRNISILMMGKATDRNSSTT